MYECNLCMKNDFILENEYFHKLHLLIRYPFVSEVVTQNIF